MSMTPAPGWYPEPNVQGTERWWDGTAWTEHRRPPPPPEPSAPAGFGPPPPMPPARGGRGKVYALAAVALVVAGSAVAAGLLMGGDDEPEPGPVNTVATHDTGPSPTPRDSPTDLGADGDPSVVVDDLNGITLPVLDGWEKPDYASDADILLVAGDSYDCPVDAGVCYPGEVSSTTVTSTDETSPKVLATDDVSKAAGEIYDKDPVLDLSPYGGMTGHKTLKEGAVTVDGREGYMVRWSVTTAKGPGHVVESLAFPSSSGSGAPVLIRYAFDTGDKAPSVDDMDAFTEGIRPAGANTNQ